MLQEHRVLVQFVRDTHQHIYINARRCVFKIFSFPHVPLRNSLKSLLSAYRMQ